MRAPSTKGCWSEPAFVAWMADLVGIQRQVATGPSCVACTFLHKMHMWCSQAQHTCPLHGKCTDCWTMQVLYTLVLCRAHCCVFCVCPQLVTHGCSLGGGHAGIVYICCCEKCSWYILVLHINIHHHDDYKGLNHWPVLLSYSLDDCTICYHALHTYLGTKHVVPPLCL